MFLFVSSLFGKSQSKEWWLRCVCLGLCIEIEQASKFHFPPQSFKTFPVVIRIYLYASCRIPPPYNMLSLRTLSLQRCPGFSFLALHTCWVNRHRVSQVSVLGESGCHLRSQFRNMEDLCRLQSYGMMSRQVPHLNMISRVDAYAKRWIPCRLAACQKDGCNPTLSVPGWPGIIHGNIPVWVSNRLRTESAHILQSLSWHEKSCLSHRVDQLLPSQTVCPGMSASPPYNLHCIVLCSQFSPLKSFQVINPHAYPLCFSVMAERDYHGICKELILSHMGI